MRNPNGEVFVKLWIIFSSSLTVCVGQYGIVADAGSSVSEIAVAIDANVANKTQGTRIHVYRWLNSARARQEAGEHELESLPVVKTKKDWTKKIRPG